MPAYYLFLDTETNGLNYHEDGSIKENRLLEVALILTDDKLNEIARYESAVTQPKEEIEPLMDDYVKQMHADGGLLEKVYSSELSKPLAEVQKDLLSIVGKCPLGGRILIAGNSVHFDKEVLRRNLPLIHSVLHFRNLDVSSVRQFLQVVNPSLTKQASNKEYKHRAMNDIEETIQELKLYYDYLGGFNEV